MQRAGVSPMLTLTALEEISKAHVNTIAVIGAFGTVFAAFATVAAVLVSLRLARRSETVRLKAILGISFITTVPSTQYVTLQINNMGVRTASLPATFFEWRIPFRRKQQPETMMNMVNAAHALNPTNAISVGPATIIPVAEIEDFRQRFLRDLYIIGHDLR